MPTTGADADPFALIQALAELHRTLAPVSVDLAAPFTGSFRTPRTVKKWLTVNRRDALAGPDHELDDLIDQVTRRWVPAHRLPSQLVHGDARIDNIGQGVDGRTVFFDFGSARWAPRIFDLGYAIAHLTQDCDLSRSQIDDLVGCYDSHAVDRSLTEAERAALRPYAACVCLLFEICRWGNQPMRWIAHLLLSE